MTEIGQKLGISLEATKGYVKYAGDIPLEQRSVIKQELQDIFDGFMNNLITD